MALIINAYDVIRKDTTLDLTSFLTFPVGSEALLHNVQPIPENPPDLAGVTFASSDERN